MAETTIPHFCNDVGVAVIHIGVKKFQCMGASPPYDHPHVYLDMGEENEIFCPYCSTLYRFKSSLSADETEPPGCRFKSAADEAA